MSNGLRQIATDQGLKAYARGKLLCGLFTKIPAFIQFGSRCSLIPLFLIVGFLCGAHRGLAMSPEAFARFLTNPPPHGHALITMSTPPVMPGETDVLVQQCTFNWNNGNLFVHIKSDKSEWDAGIFKEVEWDRIRTNSLNKYIGTNANDEARRRVNLASSITRLTTLGIEGLVGNSVRWDGEALHGEMDIPQIRDQLGVNPSLRGKFITSPDGTVQRLEYARYISEPRLTQNFAIDFRFDGKWGRDFPSYFAAYHISQSTNVPVQRLFFELKVEDWNVDYIPTTNELDPDMVFPSFGADVLSNNVHYYVSKAGTVRVEDEVKAPKLFKYLFLVTMVVPLMFLVKNYVQKNRSDKIQSKKGQNE